MKTKKDPPKILSTLTDESIPLEQRVHLLMHVAMDESQENKAALAALLDGTGNKKSARSLYAEKVKQLDALTREMKEGALRCGTFLRMFDDSASSIRRAQIVLEDGASAFVHVTDESIVPSLQCGDSVLLQEQGRGLLSRDPRHPDTGEEATLERRLDEERVAISFRDDECSIYLASAILRGKLDRQEAGPGSRLLVCPRRKLAFDTLPAEDDLAHYRFLDDRPVPDVVVERDLGDPAPYIGELIGQLRLEMLSPDLCRQYRLPRCMTRFLCGASGSGKTFSIDALLRCAYELMSEVTGAAIDDLPRRTLRLRPSEYLSEMLGRSDKNLDRFFDEVEQLASETFVTADGHAYELPVIAVLEEIDGLARARGGDSGNAVYDRILTTALQRLDPARTELRDRLVVIIATTNVAHQVDHAFLRRVGGRIVNFGRLKRGAFISVLDKHLSGLPLAGPDSHDAQTLRHRVISDVSGWLFAPSESDEGQVAVTFAGSGSPTTKYRRDFLTASVVQRAVQQAAEAACHATAWGGETLGLTSDAVIDALDQQVRGIVEQLHETNLGDYVDLPDGVRVASLRRLPRPAIQTHQLLVPVTEEVA